MNESIICIIEPSSCATDRDLAEVVKRVGTPLYIYDLRVLTARVAEFRAALRGADVDLFFATMANDRSRVLKRLADMGVGACVNSLPHLQLALGAGFEAERVQFTSTGVTGDDMRVLQRMGIHANLDSAAQLETWLKGARTAGLRINAASLGRGIKHDRIGVDAGELEAVQRAASQRGGRISGLHIYVGTNFLRPDEMLPTLGAFFDLAATVRDLQYVNIGGGIGINYDGKASSFDLTAFGTGLATYATRLREQVARPVRIIFEPGRGLSAGCGVFVTSVTDVKHLGDNRFASVDGSIAVFPRPFHHPESPHRVRCLTRTTECEGVPTTVVGRTTFSRDILAHCELPERLQVGDALCFENAGAYSQSMASRFLGQPEPRTLFLGE